MLKELPTHGFCNTLAKSRIAHGVPMGSELEYLDGNTLTEAVAARKTIVQSVDA